MSDAQDVLALSDADFKLMQLRKRLEELPQREQIMATRKQIAEVEAKAAQVEQMQTATKRSLTVLEDEQAALGRKLKAAQEKIDQGTAYKETASLTREIDGHARHIAKLEDEELALMEKADKMAAVAAQAEDALKQLKQREQQLIEAFKEQGGALNAAIAQLDQLRTECLNRLPAKLAQRYEKARVAKGGVAAAHLEGDHCSACHVSFAPGQLMKLKGEAADGGISECPHCHRILVASK